MKLQNFKKLGFAAICSSLLFMSVPQATLAKSVSDIKSEQKKVASKKEALLAEMKELDESMSKIQAQLRKNNSNIKKANTKIKNLNTKIKETEARMKEREELLGNRLRSIQETGGVSNYLEVLFGAENFSDFIRKIGTVSVIVDADQTIIEEHKKDKEALDEAKNQLKTTMVTLKEEKEAIEKNKEILDKKVANKEKVLKKLNFKANQLEAELSEQEKQQIMSAQTSSSSGGGTYPEVTGDVFMRPAVGPVTSEFGGRSLGNHFGIDIGKRGGSVPIVAAADGKVISSYYSSSYGNVVFIEHHINGRLFTTVYAHMESRGISAGASVSKGQFIGYMGNTGQSYGAHLHFEIHEGNWNGSKSNAVNPRKYVNF